VIAATHLNGFPGEASYNKRVAHESPLPSRSAITADLEAARSAFLGVAGSLTNATWNKTSANPPWTNGQVLFHVTLAFMLLPYLLPLARFFGSLPPGWSRPLAFLLDVATPVFNWVNSLGPTGASAVYSRDRLLRKYDALHAYALRELNSLEPGHLRRGMFYPQRWDPMFRGYMTLADIFRYPAIHMRHHLVQVLP
jgi:hypothetical protein